MIKPRAEVLSHPAPARVRSLFARVAWPAVSVLIVGLTLHNLLVLAMVDSHMPSPILKGLSAWKEAVIAVLLIGGLLANRARLRTPTVVDLLVLGFVLLNLVYLALTPGSLVQRLFGLRLNCMFCAAYLLGRLLPADWRTADRTLITLVLAVGGAALAGVIEVLFIPTRNWVDWGLPQYTNSLGFHYTGPFGLPENLFVNLGVLVRRAISVYLSPLALAFSIVLVLPTVLWLADRGRRPGTAWWVAVVVILLAGVALSLTRVAVLMAIAILVATTLLAVRRRAMAAFAGGAALLLIAFMFTPISASVTPATDWNLVPVPHPKQGAGMRLFSGKDDSLREHLEAQVIGARDMAAHPFGQGLGRAGSIGLRFGSQERPDEDSYLQLGVELGWLGFALALAIHVGVIVALLRRRQLLQLERSAGYWLLAVVGGAATFLLAAQSNLLGDFPVVIPLWIAIGWLFTMSRPVPVSG